MNFLGTRSTSFFANYAFENLRDEQLEPTIKKCLKNMERGGVIFIKEPHPKENKTEFDSEQHRFLRPKKAYIDILLNNGCIKVREFTHAYRYAPKKSGREFILVYKKVKDNEHQ